MSEQAQALAQRFEQTNDEAIRVVDGCAEDQWRAHHAAENRGVSAASLVRGLSDEQLDRAGELLGSERRARDVIEQILIGHVHNHLGSIREVLSA